MTNINVTQQDVELLVSLAANYNYITRDEDGALYAFVSKPTKMSDCWIALDDNNYKYLSSPHSSSTSQPLLFIQFSDKQPFQIIPQLKNIAIKEINNDDK